MRRILGSALPLALAAALLHGGIAQAATSDPLRDLQWGLDQVRAEEAWTTTKGAGAVVAVVDTGVDFAHPDLKANLLQGATFTGCMGQSPCGNGDWKGPDGEGNDLDEHGTHVSGIVAAVTDNGIGVAGTAPDAKVMPIKALEEGSGAFEDIAAGITYAIAAGNGLFGLFALDACTQSPARVPEAITVSATNSGDAKPSWANRGTCVDVFAPGINITSTWNTGATATNTISGTSMAAPHVAGAAALYLAGNPQATPAQVHAAIVGGATTGVVTSPGTGSPNRLLYTGG